MIAIDGDNCNMKNSNADISMHSKHQHMVAMVSIHSYHCLFVLFKIIHIFLKS